MYKGLATFIAAVMLCIIITGCSTPSLVGLLGSATKYSSLISENMADKGWSVPGDPIGFSRYSYDLITSIKDAASSSGDTATVAAINKVMPSERELAKAFDVKGEW